MKLYYFTTAKYGLNNVEHKRIKIARLKELNDPYEISGIRIKNMPYQAINREILIGEISKTDGIICFSKNYSSPLMWGHYAEKQTGICLGFEVSDALVRSKVLEVTYSKELLIVNIDEKKQNLDTSLVKEILRHKYDEWLYEKECRIWAPLGGMIHEADIDTGNYNYFFSFSNELRLTEIILGPRCSIENIKRAKHLVKNYNYIVEIRTTQPASKKFSILKREYRQL